MARNYVNTFEESTQQYLSEESPGKYLDLPVPQESCEGSGCFVCNCPPLSGEHSPSDVPKTNFLAAPENMRMRTTRIIRQMTATIIRFMDISTPFLFMRTMENLLKNQIEKTKKSQPLYGAVDAVFGRLLRASAAREHYLACPAIDVRRDTLPACLCSAACPFGYV